METLLIVIQIILAILIILLVLINVTKGSEYGAVFRGAETIFGGEGPGSFLNKTIMILAIIFFINSLFLSKEYTKKIASPLLTTPKVKKEQKEEIPTPPKQLPVIPE